MSAAPLDEVHWAYVFAVFAHFYHFDARAVMELTPRQTQHYLSMIPFVSEWSPDAGSVPPVPATTLAEGRLRQEAERVGLRFPDSDAKDSTHEGRSSGRHGT